MLRARLSAADGATVQEAEEDDGGGAWLQVLRPTLHVYLGFELTVGHCSQLSPPARAPISSNYIQTVPPVQKGAKRRTAIIHGATATAERLDSPFGALFRGSLRSSISCAGKPASSTMQPFTAVGIELDDTGYRNSVVDGLRRYVAPEVIPEFESAGRRVEAKKQVQFFAAPQVRRLSRTCSQKPEVTALAQDVGEKGPWDDMHAHRCTFSHVCASACAAAVAAFLSAMHSERRCWWTCCHERCDPHAATNPS